MTNDDSRNNNPDRQAPAYVGSSNPVQNYPKFPNIPELVQDDRFASLLKELLPVLNKYKCFEISPVKPKRSPWVRAFVDLYHPAGPWGKFRNAPKIDSKVRYNFKSYKILKIYEQLQMYQGNESHHLILKQAFSKYFTKEKYQKDFMAACQKLGAFETNKPVNQRVEIADVDAEFLSTMVASLQQDQQPQQRQDAAATTTRAVAARTTNASESTDAPMEDVAKLSATSTKKRVGDNCKSAGSRKKPRRQVKVVAGKSLRSGRTLVDPDASSDDEDGGETSPTVDIQYKPIDVRVLRSGRELKVAPYAMFGKPRTAASVPPPVASPVGLKNAPIECASSDSSSGSEEEEEETMVTPTAAARAATVTQTRTPPRASLKVSPLDSSSDEEEESARVPAVSPGTESSANDTQQKKIEAKRDMLIQLLEKRKWQLGAVKARDDSLCEKMQNKIDGLDEELLGLIMM